MSQGTVCRKCRKYVTEDYAYHDYCADAETKALVIERDTFKESHEIQLMLKEGISGANEELRGENRRLREAVDAACDWIAVRDREKANEFRRAGKEGGCPPSI